MALIKNVESRYRLMNKFNLSYQCRLLPMTIKKLEMVGTHTKGINTLSAGQLNIAELPELRRNS